MVGERGLAPARLADSRSAGSSIPSQPLARRVLKWSLPPVLPRHDFFTKEIHRLLQGGINGLPSQSSESEGWSQSPVLPWAQRAYDARLKAGSTVKSVNESVNCESVNSSALATPIR